MIMKAFLYVGLGGFLGSNLRFFVCDWATRKWGDQLPYGTFLVNILGSFVIGFLVIMIAGQLHTSPYLKQLMITGFLGGFTLFLVLCLMRRNCFQKAPLGIVYFICWAAFCWVFLLSWLAAH